MPDDVSRRLVLAIIILDQYLPHEKAHSSKTDDEKIPAWCGAFKEALGTPGGDCCNMCAELSELTRRALDETFQ